MLIVISGAIAVTVVSSVVVENVVKSLQTPEPGAANTGFPSGGARIGQLERMLVFILVLIGEPGAIGFLIAAKSILRFGELKDDTSIGKADLCSSGTSRTSSQCRANRPRRCFA